MEISENAQSELMALAATSPVISAQMNGSMAAGILLEDWDGNSWPPAPDCPF